MSSAALANLVCCPLVKQFSIPNDRLLLNNLQAYISNFSCYHLFKLHPFFSDTRGQLSFKSIQLIMSGMAISCFHRDYRKENSHVIQIYESIRLAVRFFRAEIGSFLPSLPPPSLSSCLSSFRPSFPSSFFFPSLLSSFFFFSLLHIGFEKVSKPS